MTRYHHITLATLCLLAFSVLAHAAPPPIGALTRINLQGTEHGYIHVSIPKAAAEKKPLPVLFWFHGTGGKPTAQFGYLAGSTQSYASIFSTGPRYEIDEAYRAKKSPPRRGAEERGGVGFYHTNDTLRLTP